MPRVASTISLAQSLSGVGSQPPGDGAGTRGESLCGPHLELVRAWFGEKAAPQDRTPGLTFFPGQLPAAVTVEQCV